VGCRAIESTNDLHNFVEPIVGHPVSDEELMRVLERAAQELGMGPRALDASIWEYQRGGPGAV
jgi:hypothetical protein